MAYMQCFSRTSCCCTVHNLTLCETEEKNSLEQEKEDEDDDDIDEEKA
jgi:hypothetical protein